MKSTFGLTHEHKDRGMTRESYNILSRVEQVVIKFDVHVTVHR